MDDIIYCYNMDVRISQQQQRIIKNKLEQNMTSITQHSPCNLCAQKVQSFTTLINHSLYGKYSSSQNFYYGKEIDEILEEALSSAYINYQDFNYYDDDEEYLKRQYKEHQYPKKIQMLSQYYKFHRDLPTWNEKHIEGIMAKYYSKVKDVDYKKIKSVLKKEQGISLTTHKSFSSFQDSEYTKKSRYSSILNDLDHSNDSLFLRDVCDKIGHAFKKLKVDDNFKGCYYSGQKKFEQFLKKQKKRKQNNLKREQQQKKQCLGLKKIKFNPKLNTKNDDVTGLKQLIFGSNHSIKQRRYAGLKNTMSNDKTTANETISRQQKSKKDKSKSTYQNPTTSRRSLSRKSNTKDPFVCDLVREKLRSIKSYNLAQIVNNQNRQSINQIYKAVEKMDKKQKISGELLKKPSVKDLVTRFKFRSNSHHNLPTSGPIISKDSSKKQLMSSMKINRSNSKKSIPISVAKGSVIELDNFNFGPNKALTSRQSSQKILRTNSSGKLSSCPSEKKYSTMKVNMETCKPVSKKRNSAIQNLLQNKLNVFKKKQPII